MSAPAPPRELADGKLLIDEPADGVVRLTISNAVKRNALDHPILDAISDTLAELSAPGSQARCVLITGAHGMFSAGYDIGEIPAEEFEERAERLVAHPFTQAIDALEAFPHPTLAMLPGHTIGGGLELALACDLRVAKDAIKLGMPPAKLGLVYSHTGLRRFIDAIGAARTRELFLLGSYIDAATALGWGLVTRIAPAERLVAHPFTEAIDALEAFPRPTLAMLPGHTIGGGLELALSCDLRVARAEIKLGMPPAKLGLVYSHTGLRRFIDAIGAPRTRELFLLGRHIDAATALQWGLVTRVAAEDELEALALELAGELADNAPLSQTGNKRVIQALLAAEGVLDEDVEQELIELRRASFASQDMQEGMRAFAERRAPRWTGS
ncbi:MAG TPA: enoyl-CoA hydratase/isomerase family protein [Solirubrobacteraceae bacterium]